MVAGEVVEKRRLRMTSGRPFKSQPLFFQIFQCPYLSTLTNYQSTTIITIIKGHLRENLKTFRKEKRGIGVCVCVLILLVENCFIFKLYRRVASHLRSSMRITFEDGKI